MSTTFTLGASSVVADLVTEYESSRESGNQLHPIIGRTDQDVSLKAAGLRTGSFTAVCPDLTTALALEALHAGLGVLTLASTELPGLDMTYVTSGAVSVQPDDQDIRRWSVSVDFAEVSA